MTVEHARLNHVDRVELRRAKRNLTGGSVPKADIMLLLRMNSYVLLLQLRAFFRC